MRKLPAIALCFLAWLALLLVALAHVAKAKDDSFGDFQRRAAAYFLSSDTAASTFVIFGPSYAVQVPLDPPFHNMGVRGSRSKEHLEILKYIRKSSTPIYVCSLREIIFADSPMRSHHANPFRHVLWSAKRSLRRRSGDFWQKKLDKETVAKLLLKAHKRLKISGVEHFRNIRTARPDTIFVLTPLRIKDKRIISLQSEFERQLSNEHFNIINLTRLVDIDDFEDIFHVKTPARAAIAEAIYERIKAPVHPASALRCGPVPI